MTGPGGLQGLPSPPGVRGPGTLARAPPGRKGDAIGTSVGLRSPSLVLRRVFEVWYVAAKSLRFDRRLRKHRRVTLQTRKVRLITELQQARDDGDIRRVFAVSRKLAGTCRGPRQRNWALSQATVPDVDDWKRFLAQPGPQGGCQAVTVAEGDAVRDPRGFTRIIGPREWEAWHFPDVEERRAERQAGALQERARLGLDTTWTPVVRCRRFWRTTRYVDMWRFYPVWTDDCQFNDERTNVIEPNEWGDGPFTGSDVFHRLRRLNIDELPRTTLARRRYGRWWSERVRCCTTSW